LKLRFIEIQSKDIHAEKLPIEREYDSVIYREKLAKVRTDYNIAKILGIITI